MSVVTLMTAGCLSGTRVSPEAAGDLSALVSANGVAPETSALLIVRLEDGAEWTSGADRLDQPFPPASTAKIPHTLIALETAYVDGPDTTFRWDGTRRMFEVWNQDHTLSSAFRASVVWVYQQIARDLGHATMSAWIRRLDYGNREIGSQDDLTTYWLAGPLETSARDQVRFLSRLAADALPLKPDTLRVGKEIMRADAGKDWALYAKSGWRMDGVHVDIGWYVGWVEQSTDGRKQTLVFAFNMDMPDAADRARRQAVVRAALRQLGAAMD